MSVGSSLEGVKGISNAVEVSENRDCRGGGDLSVRGLFGGVKGFANEADVEENRSCSGFPMKIGKWNEVAFPQSWWWHHETRKCGRGLTEVASNTSNSHIRIPIVPKSSLSHCLLVLYSKKPSSSPLQPLAALANETHG